MENTLKKKKSFFQKMAEFFFAIYVITLYIFVDRSETVIISQIAFIIFAGLTVLVILQKQRIHFGKNVMTVYLAFTWMFATYFWSVNQYIAWTSIKTMWQLFLMFFLVYNLFCEEDSVHDYFVKCLYIAGITLICYSLYTHGFNEIIKTMLSATVSHKRFGRAINQENTFGMMNATTCIVALYYLIYIRKCKFLHIVVLVFAFLLSMASGSRTSLLMICIGALIIAYKKYGIKQLYKFITITLILVMVFVTVIQLPVFEFVRNRMENGVNTLLGESGGDTSSKIRMSMIKDGWSIFKERLLTGYGANNYRLVSRFRTYSHNNYIEVLVDFGLVGFILYYFVYWNAYKNLYRLSTDSGKLLFGLFMARTIMEVSTVPYYSKIHWIMIAFFLVKPVNDMKNIEGNDNDEYVTEKNDESFS